MRKRRDLARVFVPALIVLMVASIATLAHAETDEPTITDLAWYWTKSDSQPITTPVGDVTAQTPNPFCPTNPGSGLGDVGGGTNCAEDVIPVQVVNGDYEAPEMLSAVAFDLSLIPVGSEVQEFTVRFLEDETGCNDHDEDPATPSRCRETDQLNAELQTLQACVVTQIIGGGESRPYDEIPNHQCSDSDPTATRKEIKNNAKKDPNDTDPDNEWTFDLTPFAQEWVKEFSVVTGIVIRPVEAKKEEDQQANWRVVLSGPRVANGVITKLVYQPSDTAIPPPTAPVDSGGTTTGSTSTGFTPSTSFGSTGGTTFDSGGTTTGGTTGSGATDPEAPVDNSLETALPAEEAASTVESMPAYVWLAILAGLVGASLVRSAVIESATGIRPNGALAQIRRLNAQRRGSTDVAAAITKESSGSGGKGLLGKVKSLTRRSR